MEKKKTDFKKKIITLKNGRKMEVMQKKLPPSEWNRIMEKGQ